MATTANGHITPPAVTEPPAFTTAPTTDSASSSANKRKREDDDEATPATVQVPSRTKQTQYDILVLLRQHDTTPSFLEYGFDDVTAGPQQKKARLAEPSAKATIAAKLSTGAYTTLSGLKEDAARVSKGIESSLRAKLGEEDEKGVGKLSVEELKQIQRAKGLEALMAEIVDKETRYDAQHGKHTMPKKETNTTLNGYRSDANAGTSDSAGTVLTLFGNAPTPKQLLSSMQNTADAKRDLMIKTELPVEEMSLPNGLAATKIVSASADNIRSGPTFEEAFPPPYSLPALHPPKAHKRASMRDTTITWEFKDPIHRGSRKGGYTVQSSAGGEWLGYGALDTSADAATPKERRKQRERALSSGTESSKEPASKASLEEQQAQEEEALFRRAYSSFAPSCDNSKAVVPAQVKANLWWQKVGEQRYHEVFALDPALADDRSDIAPGALPLVPAKAIEDEDFGEVIEELDELDADTVAVQQVTDRNDPEQVLRDISELLETLASHQRIRNATLQSSTPSRTPISPSPLVAAKLGKPDDPGEDEVSTYNALRRELAYLVLKLPPYAMAKLDGDQLADLGVSRLIPVQNKDVKGTMEEDSVARLAKHNAMATAAGIATLTRGNSSSSGQHYNTTANRTPAIGQAANTRYGQSASFSGRPPATQPQYQRSTSNQASYGTPTAAPRPTYASQPNQYTRPGAVQSAYQPNGQYYGQQSRTPANYSGGYNAAYSSQTPATTQQQRPAYQTAASQPLQQFTAPQRSAQTAAANAVAHQANAARTGSPANLQPRPAYQAPPQGYAQVQQPQPGSGRATPQTPVGVNGYAPPRPTSTQPLQPRVGSGTPGPQA